jgi:hypothetical protein
MCCSTTTSVSSDSISSSLQCSGHRASSVWQNCWRGCLRHLPGRDELSFRVRHAQEAVRSPPAARRGEVRRICLDPRYLYDFGEYPGLVRKSTNGQRILGELYELPEGRGPQILRDLDRYEGREFARRRVFVLMPGGRRRAAWTYVLRNGPPKSARQVESGRYRPRRGAA